MRSVIVFIVFILISCGEKVVEPPENLIEEEQMSLILYDIAILNTTKGTNPCLLYTSPSPRDRTRSRMPSSA